MAPFDTLFGTVFGKTTDVSISNLPRAKKALLREEIGRYLDDKRLPRRAATKLIGYEHDPDPRGPRRWLWLRKGKPIDSMAIDHGWVMLASDPGMLSLLARHDQKGQLRTALGRRTSVVPQATAIALVVLGLIVLNVLPMPFSGLLSFAGLVGAFSLATRAQRNGIIHLDPRAAALWVPLVRDAAHKRLRPAGGRAR